MAYSAKINPDNPGLFVFLIDQSASMGAEVPEQPSLTKADALADTINYLLQDLVSRCMKCEGAPDHFNICVVGYGHQLGPALNGSLSNRNLVTISDLENALTRVDERTAGDTVSNIAKRKVQIPIWFEPVAEGGRPMRNVLAQAHAIILRWLKRYPNCFPPVLLHVLNGESTDGDPSQLMKAITGLKSSDGNVLLFNIHISSDAASTPIAFPNSGISLPDEYAKALFDCASPLTENMRTTANSQHGMNLHSGARGYVFNADMGLVNQALDIGTRTLNAC